MVKIGDKEVKQPAVMYDIVSGLMKIGEFEEVLKEYNETKRTMMSSGFGDMVEDLRLIKIPADQALVDRIGDSETYILEYHEEVNYPTL